MIAKLKGLVDTIGEDYLIIDVNGVGYLVFASSRTLSKLERNEPAGLYIETIVREDSISLYGFIDPLEKEWFITLTKVQGVGSKVGLAILSVLSPTQVAQAVAAEDKASFSRANGVGPKLAARLVTELKNKIVTVSMADASLDGRASFSGMEETALTPATSDASGMDDAISALVNLGYQRIEAYRIINIILKDNPQAKTAELIRLSLKELGKGI
ncbi:MAG: Holliday junction branch migration protein RuvA [Lactobacillaceae bacterium]|jgi:Holliday junction DNA helicase RuvA|nr:Holliday junction branch migration protein RuvA [Lactobacillaceae bacterium]